MSTPIAIDRYAKGIDWGKIQDLMRVAIYQGFSRAAREKGVSPSSIHRQIGELEKQLGMTLVCRSERPVRLTAEGEHLCAAAKQFHESLAGFIRQASLPADNLNADKAASLALRMEALAIEMAALADSLQR